MKKKLYFKMLLLVVTIFFTNCKKEHKEPYEITEEDKKEIVDSYIEITNQVNQLLTDSSGIDILEDYLQDFKNKSGVENAWITNSSMFVKFTKGGIVSWTIPTSINVSLKNLKSLNIDKTNNKSIIGNNKVCLINQQYYDENDNRKMYCRNIISKLEDSFISNNFEVTVKNGVDANLNFISQDLNNYGIIYYISHGSYDGTHTWICSGEEGEGSINEQLEIMFEYLFPKWKDEEISLYGIEEKRDGQLKFVTYLSFSEKYVEDVYPVNSFDNSLIYFVACQSFKNTTQLAEAYISKGTGVVIGWDEINSIGQQTGYLLLESMLSGTTINETLSTMNDSLKHNECEYHNRVYLSNLRYYPNNAGDICITFDDNEANINITFPNNGGVYTTNNLTLTGNFEGIYLAENGTIIVNEVSSDIAEINGNNFSHGITIVEGDNTITVTILGKTSTGTDISATKEIHVTGNFETSIPTVTTASVTVTSSTSATSGGTIVDNGGYEIIAKGVCWSTSHDPTITDNHTDDGSGSVAFGSTINGLTANTTYYLRAYATNSGGTGYGDEIEFTTFEK